MLSRQSRLNYVCSMFVAGMIALYYWITCLSSKRTYYLKLPGNSGQPTHRPASLWVPAPNALAVSNIQTCTAPKCTHTLKQQLDAVRSVASGLLSPVASGLLSSVAIGLFSSVRTLPLDAPTHSLSIYLARSLAHTHTHLPQSWEQTPALSLL
jgi:hypothetical protein